MNWKQQLVDRMLRVAREPRTLKLLQSPVLVQGVLGVMQLRAKLETRMDAATLRLARRLRLASAVEVRELRRSVRRLERELEAQRGERNPASSDRAAG